MVNLIRSEFRKFFSTNLWWALLIPMVALALGWAWVWSALGSEFAEAIGRNPFFQRVGLSIDDLPISGFGLARAINISTIFPMVVGGLAVAGEMQRKTITTTFLTAPSRFASLTAKLITYALVGLAYGLVIVGMASAGIALGSGSRTDLLPSAADWLALVGTGLLETLLWTLLAVGIGALFGNALATVLSLLLYSILAENLLVLAIPGHGPAFFPNQSADGITSSLAGKAVLDKVGYIPSQFHDGVVEVVRTIAGSRGAYTWWIEALIFLVWAGIFFVAGWLVMQRRDVA